MRILLVEDDPDLSRQLKLALGDAGYAVDHARTARKPSSWAKPSPMTR
jgi:two-component system, OmpR family, response regulator